MIARNIEPTAECLVAAGLPRDEVGGWVAAKPGACPTSPLTDKPSRITGGDRHDCWEGCRTSRTALSGSDGRGHAPCRARAARGQFLRRHGDAVYDALTAMRSRFVRVEELVLQAADVVPGLVPAAQEVAAEEGILQRDKDGLEIDQGLFLSAVLNSPQSGRHLCHAMLLPRPEAEALLPQLERDGVVERDGASVRRIGKAAIVTQTNPRFLNAEDQTTLDGAESVSILHCSIASQRLRSCVARRSCIPNTTDAACSGRGSISRTSIMAAFLSSGISSATSAMSTRFIVGWRFRMMRRLTNLAARRSRNHGSPRWKVSRSAGTVRPCW